MIIWCDKNIKNIKYKFNKFVKKFSKIKYHPPQSFLTLANSSTN